MALIVYPAEFYDTFVSISVANGYIGKYSPFNTNWNAVSDTNKEVLLRLATDRINAVIDSSLLEESDCIKKSCSLMAVRDLVFEISSSINANNGLVSKEKVGDIEVNYQHKSRANGRETNPFPSSVVVCLNSYGASLSLASIATARLVRG
jgi:hypothetical protein